MITKIGFPITKIDERFSIRETEKGIDIFDYDTIFYTIEERYMFGYKYSEEILRILPIHVRVIVKNIMKKYYDKNR